MVTSRRRKPGQGSIRKRANGTWEARITIDRVSRSYYGRTRREAVALMEQARAPRHWRPWTPEELDAIARAQGITPGSWRNAPRPTFWPNDLDPDEFNRLIEEADPPA